MTPPTLSEPARTLAQIAAEVVACRRCPRLVAWREQVAEHRPARFAGQEYWARPVPGMGDPLARIVIVGLAPAAHGGNRTGRIFTGDRSGDFLFASLHRAGLANQPTSVSPSDGLTLLGVYVGAVNRCAPPGRGGSCPVPAVSVDCLAAELRALREARVVVPLGAFAWDGALRALAALGHVARPRPVFGHRREAEIGPYVLLGSFHPSQQNTFTGKLTPRMMDAVWARALKIAGRRSGRRSSL